MWESRGNGEWAENAAKNNELRIEKPERFPTTRWLHRRRPNVTQIFQPSDRPYDPLECFKTELRPSADRCDPLRVTLRSSSLPLLSPVPSTHLAALRVCRILQQMLGTASSSCQRRALYFRSGLGLFGFNPVQRRDIIGQRQRNVKGVEYTFFEYFFAGVPISRGKSSNCTMKSTRY